MRPVATSKGPEHGAGLKDGHTGEVQIAAHREGIGGEGLVPEEAEGPVGVAEGGVVAEVGGILPEAAVVLPLRGIPGGAAVLLVMAAAAAGGAEVVEAGAHLRVV